MQSLQKYCMLLNRKHEDPKPAEPEAIIDQGGWQVNWGDDEEDYRMFSDPSFKYLTSEILHQDYGVCLCKSCKHSDVPENS